MGHVEIDTPDLLIALEDDQHLRGRLNEENRRKATVAHEAGDARRPATNRAEFISGRTEIEEFLKRKWNRELDYRLIKELWTFRENRIAAFRL
jgi:nuclear transport factor 2 (NTF2) superfamily protein